MTRKNGARPLRRVLEDEIETLVADEIIAGKLQDGDIAEISLAKAKDGEKSLKLKVVNG